MKVTVTMEFASEAEAAAFLSGKGGTGSANTTKTETKTTETKPKSKFTREQMQAALNEVKEKFEPAAAKAIIKGKGGVDKMADIPDGKIDAVYEAAKAKVEESAGGGDDGDGI